MRILGARWLADRHWPLLEEAVLADSIDGGHVAHHVHRMQTLYAERQSALLEPAKQIEGASCALARAYWD
ncbi:MAG: hypothetical protein ROR55_10815 [Devosia sp.]